MRLDNCSRKRTLEDRLGPVLPFVEPPPNKKALKPLFNDHQSHGETFVNIPGRGTKQVIYNNFANNLEVHTAILGDSIVDSLCMDNCVAFSISGGLETDFKHIAEMCKPYRNIVITLGGNSLLTKERQPFHPASVVLERLNDLYATLRQLPQSPRVVVCSVLKRHPDPRNCIVNFNTALRNSKLPSYNITRELTSMRLYKEDGIHLNEKGFKKPASHLRAAMRQHKMV